MADYLIPANLAPLWESGEDGLGLYERADLIHPSGDVYRVLLRTNGHSTQWTVAHLEAGNEQLATLVGQGSEGTTNDAVLAALRSLNDRLSIVDAPNDTLEGERIPIEYVDTVDGEPVSRGDRLVSDQPAPDDGTYVIARPPANLEDDDGCPND